MALMDLCMGLSDNAFLCTGEEDFMSAKDGLHSSISKYKDIMNKRGSHYPSTDLVKEPNACLQFQDNPGHPELNTNLEVLDVSTPNHASIHDCAETSTPFLDIPGSNIRSSHVYGKEQVEADNYFLYAGTDDLTTAKDGCFTNRGISEELFCPVTRRQDQIMNPIQQTTERSDMDQASANDLRNLNSTHSNSEPILSVSKGNISNYNDNQYDGVRVTVMNTSYLNSSCNNYNELNNVKEQCTSNLHDGLNKHKRIYQINDQQGSMSQFSNSNIPTKLIFLADDGECTIDKDLRQSDLARCSRNPYTPDARVPDSRLYCQHEDIQALNINLENLDFVLNNRSELINTMQPDSNINKMKSKACYCIDPRKDQVQFDQHKASKSSPTNDISLSSDLSKDCSEQRQRKEINLKRDEPRKLFNPG